MNAHDQARLAATRFVLHDLQDGSFLVHDLLRDRVQLVETEAAMRLRSLQGGQLTPTSSQLAATTRSRIHELFARCRSSVTGTPSAARHAAVDVRQLSAEGWVVTERDILAQLAGAAIDEEPSIGSVAIITKDRYPTLRRCLLSVLRNRQHWSRQYRVVVLDDSEQPASRLLGARLADELSKEFATPIAYIGQDRKRHAVAAIASASGVDVDVLQFGLVGRQEIGAYPGANRNNFLLHAAGEMAVHLDDDVVCSISPTSESRPDRLALTDEAEPADCRFMRERSDALAEASNGAEDIAGVHEQVLGHRLGAVCSRYSADSVRVRVTARLVRSASQQRGRVIVSSLGAAGDSGMGIPHNLLLLKNRCLQNFVDTLGTSDQTVTRNVVRAVPQTTITAGGSLIGMAFGVDHRTLLPPFLPGFRNSDGVFALCAPICDVHGYFAHLPFVVAHDPGEDRRWTRDDLWRGAGVLRFADLLRNILATVGGTLGTSDDVADRVVSLGLYLKMLGTQPPSVFHGLVRSHFVHLQHQRARRLEKVLAEHGHWNRPIVELVRRQMTQIETSLRSSTSELSDIGDGPPEARLGRAQRVLLRYGRLLEAWPTIVRHRAVACYEEAMAAR